MKRIILLSGLLAVSLFAQAGELYRWVDKAGKVHYGDTPPPAAALVEEKKLTDVVAPSADMPYETRRAQQNFPVTLYVGDGCGEFCVQARELLIKRGIPFSEKNLVTREEIDAFKAASGGDKVPVLAVGKTLISGFSASRWNNELDIAGYPKSASYRPLPVLPAPAVASEAAPANPPAP
ncbi:NrdH-like redox domain-containing protein [Ferrigenium kumadai]|uniref:NrdH-like redox domain-containing protein n=1 Tax=Ferrigenium kumadai TaxID=1682490 RepID=A0AAN1VYP2_9PROT|nr:glutaredoxin family protein [Ferrigenium kumadai]BBI98404.1 NrdH-like redox domain-containing protein [Ferrigenium kumadai]